MTAFDLVNSPLDGVSLIEASAGTGKTYVISRLVVRLLLDRGLPIERILVVTFTEAATAELRDRILSAITMARDLLSGDDRRIEDNDPLREICSRYTTTESTRARSTETLSVALRSFDDAAIHTIHGFCYRVLRENAFETSSLFDVQLITDQGGLVQEIADDFWRRRAEDFSPLFLRYLMRKKSLLDPEELAELAGRNVGRPLSSILPQVGDDEPGEGSLEETLERAFDEAKNSWMSGGREEAQGFLSGHIGARSVIPVARAAAQADVYLEGAADPRLPRDLYRLGTDQAERALLKAYKDQPLPEVFHAVQHLCDSAASLVRTYTGRIDRLRVEALLEVRARLAVRKAEMGVHFYDDLLTELAEALRGPGGENLGNVIRGRFRAALIDEFQDTDPIQFEILDRIYGRGGLLFLIGDPKQAIYSFRGADVYAYLRAVAEADHQYTLGVNHRSTHQLVKAQNTLFTSRDDPFQEERILYHTVQAGRDQEGVPGALKFWFVGRGNASGVIGKEAARERIGRAVVAEVIALLGEYSAKDVAILVRTNRQATELQKILSRKGVPSVLHTAETLFASDQAEQLARMMAAVLNPGNESLVRAALAGEFIGLSGEQIQDAEEDATLWQSTIESLERSNAIWSRRGIYPMVQELLRDGEATGESTRTRILALPFGRRRLTNYLHLAEALHEASVGGRMAMESLLKWLEDKRSRGGEGAEEYFLRMETDEQAIPIVTIHMSKGQEWPVVICPHLWDVMRENANETVFHDPEGRLHLDLSEGSENRDRARAESLAENLRLLYVALTRAKERCIVAWGNINEADTSALAYLLHPDPTGQVPSLLKAMDDEAIKSTLGSLAARSAGSIVVETLPEADCAPFKPPVTVATALKVRSFTGNLDASYRMTSFSALMRMADHGLDLARDGADHDTPFAGSVSDGVQLPQDPESGFVAFPRGARAGTFLHAILEETSFGSTEWDDDPVCSLLEEHGFDPVWAPTITGLLKTLSAAPLGRSGVRLDEVAREDTLREVAFAFPLSSVTGTILSDLFRGVDDDLARRLSGVGPSVVRGYLRGYIDLILRWQNRYWLVDWKSNHLGAEATDYSQERLARTMTEELYTFQGTLYTLALDRYLNLRVSGYDYETHFGGVLYVYLRGVSLDPRVGVFEMRPHGSQVRLLVETLLP